MGPVRRKAPPEVTGATDDNGAWAVARLLRSIASAPLGYEFPMDAAAKFTAKARVYGVRLMATGRDLLPGKLDGF